MLLMFRYNNINDEAGMIEEPKVENNAKHEYCESPKDNDTGDSRDSYIERERVKENQLF